MFDQLLPHVANYWSKSEVEKLMADAGLSDLQLTWVNEMSWCAIGRRPEITPGDGGGEGM